VTPPAAPLLKLFGWAVAAAAAVVALVLLGQALGFRWDPFDRAGRRIEAAEARAAGAEAEVAARRLEVEGAVAQARRIDIHQQQALGLGRVTARAQAEGRTADDADRPLDPARAARLAEHDRELCHLAPAICVGPAAAEPAAGSDEALLARPVAGAADAG
jgi:hypothetical protein